MMGESLIKKYTLLYIVLVSFMGCTIHGDYLTEFHVTGNIIDERDRTSIEKAEVFFKDTGLDSVRSKTKEAGIFSIGFSNSVGVVETEFQYWWGHDRTFLNPEPKKTFKLIITKEGYKDKIFSYDKTVFPIDTNIVKIDLGEVELTPVSK